VPTSSIQNVLINARLIGQEVGRVGSCET
jgi:hypothetical protein